MSPQHLFPRGGYVWSAEVPWHCCYKAGFYKLSFPMQYGFLHMSSTVTLHVFRDSKDSFPSKSLLLAFFPSLSNCQEMNFNLEELLHLSLWICSTLDKFEDLCLFPNGALRISLDLRKFTLDFLFTVLSKGVLKSVQSPCLSSGSLPLSQPWDIWLTAAQMGLTSEEQGGWSSLRLMLWKAHSLCLQDDPVASTML